MPCNAQFSLSLSLSLSLWVFFVYFVSYISDHKSGGTNPWGSLKSGGVLAPLASPLETPLYVNHTDV